MTIVKTALLEKKAYAALRATELFGDLSDEEIMRLAANCEHLHYQAGEIIRREGERLCHCPCILSGQVEVFRHTWFGEEKIFGIFRSYDVVAIAAIFMPHNRYPMNVRARGPVELLLLGRNEILGVCLGNPQLMQRLLVHFSSKLYENINHIDWLTSSSAEQRLAAWLIELQCQQESQQLHLPLSRAQLAARLGIRYETLSRLFSGWRRKGVIEIQPGLVIIRNGDYLLDISASARRMF